MSLIKRNHYREFADTHTLVYDNNFNPEAHDVVRGMTLSTHRKDSHYTVGNINGYDIILLERTVDFQRLKGKQMTLRWSIMHTRLQIVDNLPHIFLDGSNRYHEDVYKEIFTKFSKLVLANRVNETPFMDAYRIFCNPETIPLLGELLGPGLTDELSALGHDFDYEIIGNCIYVYDPTAVESVADVTKMFSATKILANWFENTAEND